MVDAWRLAREYRHLKGMKRNSLIIELIECIKSYVSMALVTSIPFEGFHYYLDVKADHSHFLGRAYHAAFYSFVTHSLKHIYRQFGPVGLEIIFDEQGGEPLSEILNGMDEFRRLSSQHFPGWQINNPVFRSDENEPPLQAADILAWLVHRDALNLKRGIPRSDTAEALMLGEALSMPHEIQMWDEKLLTTTSLDLRARLVKATEN